MTFNEWLDKYIKDNYMNRELEDDPTWADIEAAWSAGYKEGQKSMGWRYEPKTPIFGNGQKESYYEPPATTGD